VIQGRPAIEKVLRDSGPPDEWAKNRI
jgi:hypothetical protein